MTAQQVESLKLGIAPIDDRVVLIVESALDWLQQNTTLEIDPNNLDSLSASVRLFVSKFFDVNMLSVGLQSESIEGLSQSFTSDDGNALVWQFAEELLSPYLKSRVRFVTAKRVWR